MERRVRTTSTLVVLIVLLDGLSCLAEKLSSDQKAPLFAKGSGGLALKAPYPGGGAADVGQRRGQSNPAPPLAPSSSGPSQVDGVVREETEELKEVDGQLVRVVKGSFAYDSPEGLPISVKYVADENGNRASFTFGTGKPGGGSQSSGGGKKPALTPGGPGSTSLGNGGNTGGGRPNGAGGSSGGGGGPSGQGGASTYLPPTTKVDRSYLPPN